LPKIHFILVEPAVPENVGASARAMKTMGFDFLRLVNPCEFKTGKAQWVAHASTEVLDNAEVYSTLKEALANMDFVIGSTAKARSAKGDHHPAENIPRIISKKGNSISNVAIVFGREESGLTNDELRLCDISTYVPMQTGYPSLNLSQAVMLYAYFLSKDVVIDKIAKSTQTPEAKYIAMKTEVARLLAGTKIASNPSIYHRIFERLALLGDHDINLVLSVLTALKEEGE
jgi:tRNA/rRNA methyltransferase